MDNRAVKVGSNIGECIVNVDEENPVVGRLRHRHKHMLSTLLYSSRHTGRAELCAGSSDTA